MRDIKIPHNRFLLKPHTAAMNILQAISTRKSSRTFNGLHLDNAILNRIDTLCRKLSISPDSSEPGIFNNIPRPSIKLLSDCHAGGMLGTYGVIKGARSFLAMAAGSSTAEQLLAGYLFEKIVLECTRNGLDTCWVGGTFGKTVFQAEFDNATDKSESDIATEQPGKKQTVTIISPLGHRTPDTRFAERIMRRIVSSDSRKPFHDLFEGITPPSFHLMRQISETQCAGSQSVDNISLEHRLAVALECVRMAPSARNSQPWRANVCRNLKGRPTGIAFKKALTGKFSYYDMGIAYCHLVESASYLGIKGTLEQNSYTDPSELFFSLLS